MFAQNAFQQDLDFGTGTSARGYVATGLHRLQDWQNRERHLVVFGNGHELRLLLQIRRNLGRVGRRVVSGTLYSPFKGSVEAPLAIGG